MELKFIDNPVRLQAFLNEPGNTENIVEPGHTYYIKPDAVYLGIYEGLELAGDHAMRNFWHSVIECHAVYDLGFRGEYALQGHRLFCNWLLEDSLVLNSITMVPDTTKYGRAIIRLLGATPEYYTHLTLQMSDLVETDVVDVSLKKKTREKENG